MVYAEHAFEYEIVIRGIDDTQNHNVTTDKCRVDAFALHHMIDAVDNGHIACVIHLSHNHIRSTDR